eukprot:3821692-Prymnesium_polylepis.1
MTDVCYQPVHGVIAGVGPGSTFRPARLEPKAMEVEAQVGPTFSTSARPCSAGRPRCALELAGIRQA